MLVVGAVVIGAIAFVKVGGRVPVLVVAAPVQVGQVITADDVKVVDIAPGTLAQVMLADDEDRVVGQPAAVPLVAGEVLTQQLVGTAAYPPAGYGVATAQLKAGALSPHLVVGAHVEVVAPASAAGTPAQVVANSAVVTDVSAPSDAGDVVVSVLADQDSAKAVSSATPESLSLVLLPVGG
ncbi:SAF domain-containing protein [Catenulispora sp. NL8]|uniref:SAF domain-containing protein n=1 Tax=Catenulispora pinistramenti TaxID=2705254 RepID=A0ABS5KGU9_9ACTN|nr:SAF domain-containing protein [Catenulispora pinistramenti]MBS2545484.1 SAF domain-containing protein [Catenulispora pinistramenti]